MIDKNINLVLKLLRIFHDMSVEDLAEKLQKSRHYVYDIEKSLRTPSHFMMSQYCKVFNIRPSTLHFISEESTKAIKNLHVNPEDFILQLIEELSKTGLRGL